MKGGVGKLGTQTSDELCANKFVDRNLKTGGPAQGERYNSLKRQNPYNVNEACCKRNQYLLKGN